LSLVRNNIRTNDSSVDEIGERYGEIEGWKSFTTTA